MRRGDPRSCNGGGKNTTIHVRGSGLVVCPVCNRHLRAGKTWARPRGLVKSEIPRHFRPDQLKENQK